MLADRVLAALLAVAPVAPALPPSNPPTAGSPLAGCRATRGGDDSAGTAWQYACAGGLRADVVDEPRRVDVDTFLRRQLDGARLAYGAEPRFTRERGPVGGRDAEILRLLSGDLAGTISAVIPVPEGTRTVVCMPPSGGSCDALFGALASGPWRDMAPGAVAVSAPEPRLRGRRVVVPDRCSGRTMPAGGGILCPGGRAVWQEAPDPQTAARFADQAGVESASMVGSTPAAAEPVPCRIAGAEASCRRLVWSVAGADGQSAAGPQREVILWGWTTPAGTSTFAACVGRGAEPLPVPCGAIFELR